MKAMQKARLTNGEDRHLKAEEFAKAMAMTQRWHYAQSSNWTHDRYEIPQVVLQLPHRNADELRGRRSIAMLCSSGFAEATKS